MSSVKDLLRGDVVDGSGTANYVMKWQDSDTATDSIITDNGSTVTISGDLSASSLAVSGDVTVENLNPLIRLSSTSAPYSDILSNTVGTLQFMADEGNTGANTSMRFRVDGAERMRIDPSGNVGIGTSSPFSNAKLQIRPSVDQNIAIQPGSNDPSAVRINAFNDAANANIPLEISSLQSTFVTSGSERMRITSGGRINMSGTEGTSLNIQSNRNVSGDVNIYSQMGSNTNNTSSFYFIGQNSAAGNRILIYGNGNVVNANGSYGSISDIKVKENVVDASPKLDDLLKVKVRNYNLIGDENKQIGVVAQELEEVFPSMIDESPDYEEVEVTDEEGNVTTERVETGTTTKSVKYSVFVPMLIKAVQELKAEIETLKSQK